MTKIDGLNWRRANPSPEALLGGYLGVEIAKRFLRYPGTTGDWFALVVPLSIMLGRVGCILHGCCSGRVLRGFLVYDERCDRRFALARQALVELLFKCIDVGGGGIDALAKDSSGAAFSCLPHGVWNISFPTRISSRHAGDSWPDFRGYQIASLGIVALGAIGFWRRRAGRMNGAGMKLSEEQVLRSSI